MYTDHPVVTKYICWFINQKTKHVQLIPQCLYYLHCILHYSELRSKRLCLNWFLPLAEPYYWRNAAKQQYAGIRLSCISVTTIICANKTMNRHEVASCNWHISWNRLLGVPMKTHPVTLMEPIFVDGRMCRVETQLPLWMRLQISKDSECLLKVPNSGNHEVAW